MTPDRVLDMLDLHDALHYRDKAAGYHAKAEKTYLGTYKMTERSKTSRQVEDYECFEVLIEVMKSIAPLSEWRPGR